MKQLEMEFMVAVLPVGARIRFTKTLEEGPTSDRPGCLFAVKGDGGVVTRHGCREGHWVKWDGWPSADFGATWGEDFVEAY